MAEYRCYSTDRGKILAIELLSADTDEEVVYAAETLFHNRAGSFGEFEIWERGRLVHRFLAAM